MTTVRDSRRSACVKTSLGPGDSERHQVARYDFARGCKSRLAKVFWRVQANSVWLSEQRGARIAPLTPPISSSSFRCATVQATSLASATIFQEFMLRGGCLLNRDGYILHHAKRRGAFSAVICH
jgi:hypothetical protein